VGSELHATFEENTARLVAAQEQGVQAEAAGGDRINFNSLPVNKESTEKAYQREWAHFNKWTPPPAYVRTGMCLEAVGDCNSREDYTQQAIMFLQSTVFTVNDDGLVSSPPIHIIYIHTTTRARLHQHCHTHLLTCVGAGCGVQESGESVRPHSLITGLGHNKAAASHLRCVKVKGARLGEASACICVQVW
jgi:hypothetical protein